MAAFTVGHSVLILEDFFNLLRMHEIKTLVDVRSVPYSPRNPQFNRIELNQSLTNAGFNYYFMGDTLGGRPFDESLYHDNGVANYLAVRESKPFVEAIAKFMTWAREENAALMCGEEDPITCHRALMITPALAKLKVFPSHIRREGVIETHRMFIQRTSMQAKILKIPQLPSLFSDDSEGRLFEDAVEKLAQKYAYRKTDV
ncbi:MAG: hypothetical protein RLZ61_2319 [Planctomycetota bacterium]|jgi:uncharacterized protein (DUF488 family)